MNQWNIELIIPSINLYELKMKAYFNFRLNFRLIFVWIEAAAVKWNDLGCGRENKEVKLQRIEKSLNF